MTYAAQKTKQWCELRDCTDGVFEVTRQDVSTLIREAYDQGKRDAAAEILEATQPLAWSAK